MDYDFKNMRWSGLRPYPFRWSDIVLGRRATQAKIVKDGTVTVSAYNVSRSSIPRYTDPVTRDRSTKTGRGRKRGRVNYLVRVTLKPDVHARIREQAGPHA